jgi:LAO/AO transport system kinase
VHPIAERVLNRDLRGVARACRLVDDRVQGHLDLLKDLYPHTGHAWIVGVTGNPGAGKSTLTDKLIALWRSEQKRVAVVAVDPTSPYTGGAILGDRIRMQRHFEDPDVFIRSLATRGALGGLSRSAADIVRVLDAWGADVVIVETVGVGQDELEVTRTAHTTLVVVSPGLGDDVQAAKAGILECADVFGVNKADREGVDATVRDLELMIALGRKMPDAKAAAQSPQGHYGAGAQVNAGTEATAEEWVTPVLRCVATRNEGISQLAQSLAAHRRWLISSPIGVSRTQQRLREQIHNQMRDALLDAAMRDIGPLIDDAVSSVSTRQTDPYSACERLVEAFRRATASS